VDKVQVGNFIRDNRKLQGLSQQGLAEKAGLTRRQQIIEMENAQYDYGIDVLIKVINALGFKLATGPLGEDVPADYPFDFAKVESAREEAPEKPAKKVGGVKKKK